MDAALLWPDRPADKLQTFFLRIPETGDRRQAFEAAARALRSVRWHDFGAYTLRLPTSEPWLVVDWHALLELPNEALESVSERLGTELVALSAITGHGRSTGHLYVRRLISGRAIPGHTVETREDRVTPVSGPQDRLPSVIPVQDLPEFAAALKLPENTLPGDAPTLQLRCIPLKLAVWAAVLVGGGLATLLLT